MGESFPPLRAFRAGARCARRRWAVAAAAVALWAVSSPVRAAELHDPASGFRMPLDVHGARTCMAFPKRSADPECAGLPLDALGPSVGKSAAPFGAGVIVRDDKLVYVTGTSSEGRLETKEDIEAYIGAMEAEMARQGKARVHGAEPSARYDVVRVNGFRAVRYVVELETAAPESVPVTAFGYAFPGERHTVTVLFLAVDDDASELSVVDGLMVGAALSQPATPGFGEPRRNQIARAVGALVGSLFPFFITGAIAVALILWKRRRARAAK
jgi:hypothetical protein